MLNLQTYGMTVEILLTLYNLDKDRTETNNLIQKHPKIADKLKAMWHTWAQNNYVYPLDNRGWYDKIKASVL